MMSMQCIRVVLWPNPPKKQSSHSAYPAEECHERKPIPGWTNGSHAWCASVYNLSAPLNMLKPLDEERVRGAYRGFVTSSQHSGGVYPTMLMPTFKPASPSVESLPAVTCAAATSMQMCSCLEADELGKYPLLHLHCDSRQLLAGVLSTLPTGSTCLMPATMSTRRMGVLLVKHGAEGRLLVPDVKMTWLPPTMTMLSMTSAGSSYGYYAYCCKPNLLSCQNSDVSMEINNSLFTEAGLAMQPPLSSPVKRFSSGNSLTSSC